VGPTALLPFRRKACSGFFGPEKSWRLRPGLNPRTWVLKGSTLPLDHWSCSVSVLGWGVILFSGIPREGFGVLNPSLKFWKPSKIVPNSTQLWKLLKIAEFRTPKLRDVKKKGSKILKLPMVHSCFTLAMTNKLVVVINSLKVPKIKKILLYEMKFLVPNYSCLQNPWLGGYRPPDPRSLCPVSSTEFVEPHLPEQNSWVRHWLCMFWLSHL